MKAVLRRKYGPPKQLEIADIPIPSVSSEEILVEVKACTINRTDCAIITGKPYAMRLFLGLFKPKISVPGTDCAGVVSAVGSEVTRLRIGDAVWAFHDEGIQSQAEKVVFDQNQNVFPIPEKIAFMDAAAALEGGFYAHNFMRRAKLEPGQQTLLNGATGAIGSALLQFLKAEGHWVTAVGNTKNIKLIKSLGADRIYDYEVEDFTADKDRYDVIFDAVGKSTFSRCKHLLKAKGKYLSSELGPWWQNVFLAVATSLGRGRKVIFPVPSDIPSSMAYIKGHLEAGTFTPVIDRIYLPAQIVEAYTYVASGEKTGNVVLNWSSSMG